MRAIIIDEKKLDELLEAAREKLQLETFRAQWQHRGILDSASMIDDLHRSFNYHLCHFRDLIKEST